VLDDGTPIFQQLAAQIEKDVLDGTYAEEAPVASTTELAAF
jgi:DNA-binding transcriptional regulator YhcF (GntR family)